jgi:hypothetical protein
MNQSVAAPDSILRLVKLVGSIAPPARASLQSTELAANATSVVAVSAMVNDADRAGCSVRSPSAD